MITRISPVIIRRRVIIRGRVASVTADPSSLQVFPEVSKEEPYVTLSADERGRRKTQKEMEP